MDVSLEGAGLARSPWRLLPADISRHIFSLFSLRPRLLVLRCVCKRWDEFVLQTVKHIHLNRGLPQQADQEVGHFAYPPWARFINLTSCYLDVDALAEAKPFLTRLRSLGSNYLIPLPLITALTNLRLDQPPLEQIFPLIIANPNLESISLSFRTNAKDLTIPPHVEFPTLHLKQLRHFSFVLVRTKKVGALWTHSWLAGFLVAHHAQLTELSLNCLHSKDLLPSLNCAWPLLRSLSLSAQSPSADDFLGIIINAPAVTRLSLELISESFVNNLQRIIDVCADKLVSINYHYFPESDAPRVLELLNRCTRLENMVSRVYVIPEEWSTRIGTRLTALKLSIREVENSPPEVHRNIHHCSNLTQLLMDGWAQNLAERMPAALPFLRELQLDYVMLDENFKSDNLAWLLSRCTALRRLSMVDYVFQTKNEVLNFADLLQACGVERFQFCALEPVPKRPWMRLVDTDHDDPTELD